MPKILSNLWLKKQGGINMVYSKLKILFYLTIGVTLLFAPVLLEISPDGQAHAMGLLGGSGGNNDNSSPTGITISEPAQEPGPGPTPVSHAPEPATLILFGAGALGLAAYRKKFRKK